MQRPKKNRMKSTAVQSPPLQAGSEYQVGALTAIFIVMLLLKYSFFGSNVFMLGLFCAGLIAAVVFCGNVRLRFTFSGKELLVAFGLLSSIIIILFLIGIDAGFSTEGLQRQYDFLSSAVGAPVSEETFYRLFLLNLLVGLTGRRFHALTISSILFDLNHIAVRYAEDPSSVVIQMIGGIVPALTFGIVFLYSRNLGITIATHSVWNIGVSLRSFPSYYSLVLPILLICIFIPAIYHIVSEESVRQTLLSRKWHFGIEKDQGIVGLGIVLLIFLTFGSFLFLLQFYVQPTGFEPPYWLLHNMGPGLAILVGFYILAGATALIIDAIYRMTHQK